MFHIGEEYWGGEGFPLWISRVAGVHLTTENFLILNCIGAVLMIAGIALVSRWLLWRWTLTAWRRGVAERCLARDCEHHHTFIFARACDRIALLGSAGSDHIAARMAKCTKINIPNGDAWRGWLARSCFFSDSAQVKLASCRRRRETAPFMAV